MILFRHDLRLPSLPVPGLEHTARLLERALQPISSGDDLRRCEPLIGELLSEGGAARRLQELLVEWRESLPANQSWLRPFWDDAYLCHRQPLPINMNYCFQIKSKCREDGVSSFVSGLCRVLCELRDGELPPELLKSGYQSMEALGYAIYTRTPGEIRDSFYFPRLSDNMTAAVVCRGFWHILSLCGDNGEPLPPGAIESALERIRSRTRDGEPACVGAMTCAPREPARSLRAELSQNMLNRLSLDSIERALFVICLDGEDGGADGGADLLCGDPKNRWFDKSLQIIARANGEFGVNLEHSGCDAAVWVYLLSLADGQTGGTQSAAEPQKAAVRDLNWVVGQNLGGRLESAAADFGRWSKRLSFAQKKIPAITKTVITQRGRSPDFFAQMLFQLTYYRQTGKLRSVYEAVSTRGFYQGRTECVRPCTAQSARLIKALSQGGDGTGLKELLDAAEREHRSSLAVSRDGFGAERHMAGLAAVFEMHRELPGFEDLRLPGIFSDPAYLNLRHDAVSTSSVTAPFIGHFGFGPVVEDGIGIGYGVEEEGLRVMVSAYEESGINARAFTETLEACAGELLRALE